MCHSQLQAYPHMSQLPDQHDLLQWDCTFIFPPKTTEDFPWQREVLLYYQWVPFKVKEKNT
ncbi:hypothetical protein DOY81_002088 [Sarcophaga bullata]|nr:hypothetical protein DOY81_002088 [Sarcophaga bullata]